MQAMESGAVELAFLVLIAAFYIFRFFINKWNALHRAKWQFEINNEMQLPFLISVARLKISRTPSGNVTTLEEDLVMAEVSCELPCPPQHQACVTRSVVPSILLKISRACRRSCWRTAACCRSSAIMRKTHGGSGGSTGGCMVCYQTRSWQTRSPSWTRALAQATRLRRSAGNAGVAALCAVGSSALWGRAALKTTCHMSQRICLLALLHQPMARACTACFNTSQQHADKTRAGLLIAMPGVQIRLNHPMDIVYMHRYSQKQQSRYPGQQDVSQASGIPRALLSA